jgi:hypothetical protein
MRNDARADLFLGEVAESGSPRHRG